MTGPTNMGLMARVSNLAVLAENLAVFDRLSSSVDRSRNVLYTVSRKSGESSRIVSSLHLIRSTTTITTDLALCMDYSMLVPTTRRVATYCTRVTLGCPSSETLCKADNVGFRAVERRARAHAKRAWRR